MGDVDRTAVIIGQAHHVDDLRLAHGDRTGLVEHHGVDAMRVLERLRRTEQHTILCTLPRGDGDAQWGRQSKRARAGDDEHTDRTDNAVEHMQWHRSHLPEDEGPDGDDHDDRHEHAGHPVRNALDGRLRGLRVTHEPNDLCEHGLGSHTGGTVADRAIAVDRRTDHAGSFPHRHRHRLACHHRLVDACVAAHNNAVDRQALAGAHLDDVAHRNVGSGDIPHTRLRDDMRRVHPKSYQRLDRRTGAGLRLRFEQLSEDHQRDDRRHRLVIGFA